MRHRTAVLGTALVTVTAGVVALAAAAVDGDRDCETFADALDAGVTRTVCGPFLDAYRAEGGPAGYVGPPVTDEAPNTLGSTLRFGDRQVGFRRGAIYLDTGTGETAVGAWYSDAPLRSQR